MHLSTSLPVRTNITIVIVVITCAQLFATSLWFSANSAAFDLMQYWHIGVSEIGWLTNAVQAGFILGTFITAITGIADRFPASLIFSISAVSGALFNLGFAWFAQGMLDGMIYRFLVGICLAGIYPIGMKLAVQWVPNKKGQVLSILVAMLTLGTALPYALNDIAVNLNWRYLMSMASLLAFVAAIMVYIIGTPQPIKAQQPQLSASSFKRAFHIFRTYKFKAAALGYFGHMWELYAFWTIVPLLIVKSNIAQDLAITHISLLTFFVIATGALGCLFAAWMNKYVSSACLAIASLALSGLCCVIFAIGWSILPSWSLLLLLSCWAATVIADSPQFSALSADACPPEQIGAALALQNAIGFSITIVSITLITSMFEVIGLNATWILMLGPVFGILGFYLNHNKTSNHIKNVERYSA